MHYAPIPRPRTARTPASAPSSGRPPARAGRSFGALAVFHGHAHHGALEGRTAGGVPVYNVAMPLLRKLMEDRRFRVFEL